MTWILISMKHISSEGVFNGIHLICYDTLGARLFATIMMVNCDFVTVFTHNLRSDSSLTKYLKNPNTMRAGNNVCKFQYSESICCRTRTCHCVLLYHRIIKKSSAV